MSQLRSVVLNAAGAATELLFPPLCTACSVECEPVGRGPLWCAECDDRLQIVPIPTCPRCGLRRSEADAARDDCGHCRGRRLLYDGVRTIGPYQAGLRQAVLLAKHAAHEPLAFALGQRLADSMTQRPLAEPIDLIAPVPMHWLKRLWRSTNPPETVARGVASELRVPLALLLVCRRYLRRQATLSPAERRLNVRGAFRVAWRYRGWPANIRGQRILLVDDVMTTGATAHEASRVLREAGAACVYVATVARANPDV